jgi:hypothetical protein
VTDKINVTIRLDKSKSDFNKLKRIMKEMGSFEISATNKNEALRQWNDELHRRLIAAGLSK